MCIKLRAPQPRELLTADANSEATADGHLGVDDADDATHVVSGANGVAAADVCQGEGVTAVRVASPSTPGTNSETIANGHPGVNVAGNGRVSPVDVLRTPRTWPSAGV